MSAKRAFAVNSGMTALDVITRLVKAGEEVIAGNDLYGGKNPSLHSHLRSSHFIYPHCSFHIPPLSPPLPQLAHNSSQPNPNPNPNDCQHNDAHSQANGTRQVQAYNVVWIGALN
jgi:cystathionine beta-lyase